jgi:hypothetical protein
MSRYRRRVRNGSGRRKSSARLKGKTPNSLQCTKQTIRLAKRQPVFVLLICFAKAPELEMHLMIARKKARTFC